jgi:hypothetical protein
MKKQNYKSLELIQKDFERSFVNMTAHLFLKENNGKNN